MDLRWLPPDSSSARRKTSMLSLFERVHFAGRIDQICFKTYAAADSAGRHLTDLIALAPTSVEMEFAASWVTTQDDSEGFGSQLTELIDYLEERRADGTL
ncbi:MAG: hypothetical protein U1E26_00910 [Coriobacteriia bacterium]|nr:hypothetical protein [Coriobacteriia bacterium]